MIVVGLVCTAIAVVLVIAAVAIFVVGLCRAAARGDRGIR